MITVSNNTVDGEFERNHPVGDLLVPKNLDTLPVLSVSRELFFAPKTVDLRDYCLPPTDQGTNPYCAAHACSGFAGNVLWRKTDLPRRIDPNWLYTEAKKIDGMEEGSQGTTLYAVLQVLLNYGVFDPRICNISILRTSEQIKYAIHKFGCCLLGFNISKEWYLCNKQKSSIYGQGDQTQIGGHAVLGCGFNRDGLIIQNSWGGHWGQRGYALISWKEVERQFIYGAVPNNCLYGMVMNG